MLSLRAYQHALVAQIADAWSGAQSVLAVLPTGAGKTVVFSSIVHAHTGAAAVVVHRKEIVAQIACSLAAFDVRHRVIAPPPTIALIRRKQLKLFGKSFVDPNAECGVVSVQTMTSRNAAANLSLQRWLARVTLAVFDEGHHYVKSGLWAKAVESVSRAQRLFVTATPERADGKGLGAAADGFANAMIEGPGTKWLIDQGYLSAFKYLAPHSDLDVKGVPVTASGDLNIKALRARVVESHLVGDVVQHYQRSAGGKRAIVFAADVATAGEIADAFRSAGLAAAALSGKTDAAIRERELARFESGELNILVNVDLFDEGFDVPAVEVVILARPTQSLAKFLQMIGRSLRPVYAAGGDIASAAGRRDAIAAGSKPHALVIDPVRNWERHGMPNWPRIWTLESRPGREGGGAKDLIPQRVCLGCTQPFEKYLSTCPYCGTRVMPGSRGSPKQVEGDLHELDVDALAALFRRIDKADSSDQEYEIDQIARRIPPIGRPADLRRHQAAKYRRLVLKELVAWWIGFQPLDRDLSEKHRRFFHRFNIDIGTAFTLNAADTDALIARMQAKFSEDIVDDFRVLASDTPARRSGANRYANSDGTAPARGGFGAVGAAANTVEDSEGWRHGVA